MLLHKTYEWYCVKLLKMFSPFSDIQLFKPNKYHAEKSSFYLVTKNVQPKRKEVIQVINIFRSLWCTATFGTDQGKVENDELVNKDDIVQSLAKVTFHSEQLNSAT